MTDERTPLQRLDDAVHDFLAAAGHEGTPSGWVLGFQTSFYADNGPDIEPITWDASYAVSPGLSPFAAAGLADYVSTTIGDVYRGVHQQGDDE